jgi:hypothetical protein
MRRFIATSLIIGLCGVIMMGLTGSAYGVTGITLIDGNSTILVDPTSQAGMYQWNVNNINYDAKQWFWYRIGNTGPEASIDTISAPVVSLYDLTGEGDIDTARMVYNNNNLKVDVKMGVTGSPAGGGLSDIDEVIRITNNTASTMDLHFFQYNNFILSAGNDTVNFVNNNRVVQTGPVYGVEELYNEGESVVTGAPIHEAALVYNTLNSLNDLGPTTLNGNGTAGPGNVSWAFQWNLTIPAGGVMIISKDKILNIVPEPSSIVLLSIFAACSLLAWRFKR